MEDQQSTSSRKYFNTTNVKAIIAAVVFHIIYSFIFGMLIGGKNPFVLLYEKDWELLYMILTPLIASLPYLLSGYLIIVAISSYKELKRKNINLFLTTIFLLLTIYLISYFIQYLFPYRDMFKIYVFINYPAASYLSAMDLAQYSQNFIVLLSVLFPPLMTFLGGYLRIKTLNKGDVNE